LPGAYVVGRRVADGDEAPGLSDPTSTHGVGAAATGNPHAVARSRRPDSELRADRVAGRGAVRPGYLVLVDATTDWRAASTADPLLRANLAFRAAQVPKGTHRIEILFRPRSVVVGLVVSAVGIAAALGLAVRHGADAST
jgi:hypothetical protein